jgi:hypothetical protein
MDIVGKNTKIKLTGSAKLTVLIGSSKPGIVLDIEQADLAIDLCTDIPNLLDIKKTSDPYTGTPNLIDIRETPDLQTGTPELMDVRRASALEKSYVTSDSFDIRGANQLQLWVSFIKGKSGGCRLRIEFSEDGANWYQESEYSVDAIGDVRHKPAYRNIQPSSNIIISIPISACFFRVSAASIGSGTGTSLSIMATAVNL